LRDGAHFKANPGNVRELCRSFNTGIEWQDSDSAARRLIAGGYAKSVPNTSAPGIIYLRLTDTGIAEADNYIETTRKPTIFERAKNLPWGSAVWDIFKIAFGALLGFLAAQWTRT
jgi:hypothetical protein